MQILCTVESLRRCRSKQTDAKKTGHYEDAFNPLPFSELRNEVLNRVVCDTGRSSLYRPSQPRYRSQIFPPFDDPRPRYILPFVRSGERAQMLTSHPCISVALSMVRSFTTL